MQKSIPVVFVIGPTASGKTSVSYEIAKLCGGQIVNADVGQFYAPLAVGTAKPAWRDHVIKAHLFDICDEPKDFSVVQYRSVVLDKIRELQTKGIVPVVVGGSLFYVQSLFFPPITIQSGSNALVPGSSPGQALRAAANATLSWHTLSSIDSVRAAQIHPNDHYRIKRALDIWATTGMLPSQLEPTFNFSASCYIVSLEPEKHVLRDRIEQRTKEMLEKDGWIEEAQQLLDTDWEPFVRTKGLIGYDLIFDALRAGTATPETLQALIALQTTQYAKRQMTFLRSMTKKIFSLSKQTPTIILQRCSDHMAILYAQVARLVAYLQK